MNLTVVIPTLNEAAHLPATLAALRGTSKPPRAIVVADCNSTDRTAALAREAGVAVVQGPSLNCRAAALQAGIDRALADHPDTDVLWMLHADTLPPADWRQHIESSLEDTDTIGGAFAQRFHTTGLSRTQRHLLHFVCRCNRLRYRITGVYFGDQGIFVRPAALRAIGGVPQAPLMEDVDLCRLLQKHGRLRVCDTRITTSPRRFLRHGIIRQLLHDWLLLLTHRLGLRPQHLYTKYNLDNHTHATTPA